MRMQVVVGFAVLALWQTSDGVCAEDVPKKETVAKDAPEEEANCPLAGDPEIAGVMKLIRQKCRLPGMAGAIITSDGRVRVGVAGVRKRGTAIPLTVDDKWHIGSDTKAMTATLIAQLVEQKRLTWETTLAEVFPKLSAGFHKDMRDVTVLQLLCHRAGLPMDVKIDEYGKERLRAVREELAKAPKSPVGSKSEYSNLGYIIAGAVVEKITGQSWEEAITARIFKPLKMEVGFGGVGTPGKIDQPWGHTEDEKPVAKNGPAVDNPPVMAPAGCVHCTLQDWAKFLADQLRGRQGEPSILKKSGYEKLHTPAFDETFALGWLVVERPWGGGAVLNHGGSNTMYFANVWVAPKRGFAVVVCTNQGGNLALQATDAAAGELIVLHCEKMKKEEDR